MVAREQADEATWGLVGPLLEGGQEDRTCPGLGTGVRGLEYTALNPVCRGSVLVLLWLILQSLTWSLFMSSIRLHNNYVALSYKYTPLHTFIYVSFLLVIFVNEGRTLLNILMDP